MTYRERSDLVRAAYADYLYKVEARRDGSFPHCDDLVLHAPGICKFCDKSKALQELRGVMDIAYTGEDPGNYLRPCPSTLIRDVATIEKWPNNRPSSPSTQKSDTEAEMAHDD